MKHLTRHGGSSGGDALDLYVEESRLLQRLFDEWDRTIPCTRATNRQNVKAAYRHGTVAKLIVEHTALRLAAADDLAGLLLHLTGDPTAIDQLSCRRDETVKLLRRLDELARGLQPIAVGRHRGFAWAADELRRLHGGQTSHLDDLEQALAEVIGDHRSDLHSSRYLRRHAPTHPATRDRRWSRWSPVKRAHAIYDRLRGFPWAESEPFASSVEANRFDPDR